MNEEKSGASDRNRAFMRCVFGETGWFGESLATSRAETRSRRTLCELNVIKSRPVCNSRACQRVPYRTRILSIAVSAVGSRPARER